MRAPTALGEVVVERTIELAAVAGPPLAEAARGDMVEGWWRADGLDPRADATGNRWARLRRGRGPATVVCAHLDTVFDPAAVVPPRRAGDRLVGPGVGDDSVALAALSALDALLPAATRAPVWALATVGEEGAGDLAGIRAALADPAAPVGAVIAVEGNYLGRICTTAVGSVRWRARFEGPGGHAWEAADAPSAVHAAAAAATALAALSDPPAGVAVNVGRFTGGEGINVRAATAAIDVDLRADHPVALAVLDERARRAVARAAGEAVHVAFEPLGRRPAGRIAPDHPLVEAAAGALEAIGRPPTYVAASTDANAAHAAGVPAVAVGVTTGGGEHTTDEWIALSPLRAGLEALADTIARWDGAGVRRRR